MISDSIMNQLDSLFFLPLKENETLELRSIAIEAFLESHSLTWDDILDNITYERKYE